MKFELQTCIISEFHVNSFFFNFLSKGKQFLIIVIAQMLQMWKK